MKCTYEDIHRDTDPVKRTLDRPDDDVEVEFSSRLVVGAEACCRELVLLLSEVPRLLSESRRMERERSETERVKEGRRGGERVRTNEEGSPGKKTNPMIARGTVMIPSTRKSCRSEEKGLQWSQREKQ